MGKIILSIGINVFFLMNVYVSGSFITTVPETQYVYVNDTVTFECRTNVTEYRLSIYTNPPDVTDLYPLHQKWRVFLNLRATSKINGTEVICQAHQNNRIVETSPPALLYVQGPPDSVSNLTGYQLDSCCMFISWYPPFTLPGLTVQYIISVGTDQQYLNDSITSYTYCPMGLTNKQYLFNITTTNEVGTGSTSNITIRYHQSIDVQLYVTDKERGDVNWTYHFNVSVHQLCTNVPPLMNIKGCTKDNCYSTTNVSISNSSYNNISLVVQFPSNKTLNTNAILYYRNGVTVQSNTITISTHDLQKFTLINITSNSVCLQFQYVNGSTLFIDVILLIGDRHYFRGYLIPPNDQLNFINCTGNLPAGNNLTLYACKLVTIENCTTDPFAVITGINITDGSTSSVLMSSVHSSSVSLTSTVLTTPSMMSVPLIVSTSPVVTISSVPTTSTLAVTTNSTVPTASSTPITSSMMSLPIRMTTSSVPTPSIMSEFETFPSSVLTTSTTSLGSTTSIVQLVTSSSSISSTTDTPTISSSTSIPTTRLTSTLVTDTLTATLSSVIAPSSKTSSFIALSFLSSLSPSFSSSSPLPSSVPLPLSSSSAQTLLSSSSITSSSFPMSSSITLPTFVSSSSSITSTLSSMPLSNAPPLSLSSLSLTLPSVTSTTSSSPTPSLTAPSSISSSSSIIGLASGISIALLIIIIVVIVIVVVAATVGFKKRRGKMEVTTGNIYSTGPNMIPLNGVVRDDPPPNTPPAVVPPPIYTEVRRFKDNSEGGVYDKVSRVSANGHQTDHNVDSNRSYYSTLNAQSGSVYDTLQHNNNSNPVQPRVIPSQEDSSQYSSLGVVAQASKPTPVPLGQYSVVSVDNMPTGGTPLVHKELTRDCLSTYVVPRLTRKWYEIGLGLALTPPELEEMRNKNEGLVKVFQVWEEMGTRPFTWFTLLSVLRSPDVDEYELADELSKL